MRLLASELTACRPASRFAAKVALLTLGGFAGIDKQIQQASKAKIRNLLLSSGATEALSATLKRGNERVLDGLTLLAKVLPY